MNEKRSGPLYLIFLIFSTILLVASPMLAIEIINDFEGPNPLAGYTVDGWGIRTVDSCQWGPQTSPSGNHAVGVPDSCEAGYPNGDWRGRLTTPAFSTALFPSLFLGFTYWSDFESVTDNFDGVILEFINLTQGTTVQIDSLAEGQICPTYDERILPHNIWIGGRWAFCWDTLAPAFNSLGYPFLILQTIRPGEEVPDRGLKQPNMPTEFEWRSLISIDLIAAGYATQGDSVQIRWVFASDPLSNGEGYFFDDLFISSDPPSDTQPPEIEVVSPAMWANVPDSGQAITITADITEGCGGSGVNPDSVFLVYEVEGVPQADIAMDNTGGDTYEGDLPGQPYDTDIRYRVRATDNMNNPGSSPWRHLEVTDAITLSWDDGAPASVWTGLQAGDGFSVRFSTPADSMYLLHKIMFYFARENGQFHVVANRDNFGPPGTEIYRASDVTNGNVANTFFQFEFSPTDSVIISEGESFHVGFRLATSDTLFDPQQLTDSDDDVQGESWVFTGGGYQEPTGETLIRCKVKQLPTGPVGVGDDPGAGGTLPKVYSLGQNYPNPFNPSTTIRFSIPAREGIEASVLTRLSIYNMRGQLVRTLIDEEVNPGEYTVQWDGKNEIGETTGSGIYLYHLQTGDFNSTKKMVVVK